MKKFKVYIPCDYVDGHLRYGHLEGEIQAENIEEIKNMKKDGFWRYCELIIDDYEVNSYEANLKEMEIEEIKGG